MSPERELLAAQSRRLAPLRERLLRRVSPGTRGATLDLASGFGALTSELRERVRGPVISVDLDAARRPAIRADAHALPFRDASFDLVVTQCAWMWFPDRPRVAREVRRVLAPGGALVAVGEPDFGGAIEHPAPSALAPTWESALRRAGAEPRVGRELPSLLRAAGFARVECEMAGTLAEPSGLRAARVEEAALLRALGLTADEDASVARALEAQCDVSFVPMFGLLAWC